MRQPCLCEVARTTVIVLFSPRRSGLCQLSTEPHPDPQCSRQFLVRPPEELDRFRCLSILSVGLVQKVLDFHKQVFVCVKSRHQHGLMALSVGDHMGNLLTPFWAVVGAGIARVEFRELFGYRLIFAALWFSIGLVVFTFIPV